MLFKNNDILIGYITLMIPLLVLGSLMNIHELFFYTVYIPLLVICKIEDWGVSPKHYVNQISSHPISLNQISSKIEIELNKFNSINDNRYTFKNYKVDYKLHGYSNVVREYTQGNNLYEVQRKYLADPKVNKLIRVVQITA